MARIRTIKPEFWTSEQVMDCSTNTRLLFIGLWNFCDDAGRMAASAKRIKASIFPSDDFTSDDVRRMIDELSSNGLIRLYVVDDIEYLLITGWHHQKIDRPQKSKIPDPPDPNSPNGRRTFGVGREGNGRERKGKENNPPAPAESHPARPTLNEAGSDATEAKQAGPGRAWASRENFDRVEQRCRGALGDKAPMDPQIGPMARLEADGFDLDAEIVPALLDVVAGARVPIRTWRILADRIAERIAVQRQARTAQGLAAVPKSPPKPDEMVDLGSPFGSFSEAVLRVFIGKHRESGQWIEHMVGPAPGQPGCRIPARLLIGEAA